MKRNGFTLVELLIGSMIGAIVLMSVYVAFNAATKYWNKNNSATSAQQTARFASDHLSKNLKIASGSTTPYTINTVATVGSGVQTLTYVSSAGTKYYHYFFPDFADTTRAGKIYWGTSATPTDAANQPLTGDNVTGSDAVKIFARPASGSGNVNPAEGRGIFSSTGATATSDWTQTSTTCGLVYIDFIAQDYSASSRSQTASGQAQSIEIRTAVTYPHL
ncbi:MAG: prepilin-type N-terminal cleavage/methylation domain-containing protein [Bacillota bacterium]